MNDLILSSFVHTSARLVAVTKYLDRKETHQYLEELKSYDFFWGIGENRVDSIKEKQINRSQIHFIGNIQSRDILEILKGSSVVHSLSQVRHFPKIEKLLKDYPTQFFLQIQVSEESSKLGINTTEINAIWENLNNFPQLKNSIIGFSALGTRDATEEQTTSEVGILKDMKRIYLPGGLVSYGTSQDYKESIKNGSDVLRIGRGLWK